MQYIGALIFNAIVAVLLLGYYLKKPKKAKEALRLAYLSGKKLIPLLLIILFILVILQSSIDETLIKNTLDRYANAGGYAIAALAGAGLHAPPFIAFPIGGELLRQGLHAGLIATFLTSLIMVHTFSIPIEIKELGFRFALTRNLLSLCASFFIGYLMGVLF